jgi:LmbE family N-acetylglucosaminyl deacetylase
MCLVLAALLLAIPTQPYAGAALPVNMAMLTTRNLEYVIFLAALLMVSRMPAISVKSWRLWVATGLLGLLIASDGLFLSLSVGSALLALFVYGVRRNRQLVRFAGTWLLVGVGGAALALGLQWAMNAWLLHVVGGGTASPYNLVANVHDLVLGVAYAVMGLLTNLGANPAFDAIELKQIPSHAWAHLWSLGGVAYLVNLAVAGYSLYTVQKLIRSSLRRPSKELLLDEPARFASMLVMASVVALITFVATNHYYPVDARYLAISFFAVIVTLAVYLRRQPWVPRRAPIIAAVLIAGILSGLFATWGNYKDELNATATIRSRNDKVAAAMQQHDSDNVLLGDYWRVLPIRQAGHNSFDAFPLSGCTDTRDVLTSTAWRPDADSSTFAYLLSYDTHTPDFPSCTLQQVVNRYGKPNASTVIDGTLDAPREVLLFYDHGINSNPSSRLAPPATVVPTTLGDYPVKPTCAGKTILTTVAHEDDDLLFMNPDHLHAVRAGDCLRTLYITAGDAGGDKPYWLGREKGSEEAYKTMIDDPNDIWVERIVKLANNEYLMIATPRGRPDVSLLFLRLPDGNLNGMGFRQTHFQSLAHLESGKIPTITGVDGQSTFSKASLVTALEQIISFYKPDEIHTQVPVNLSKKFPDHSDHLSVGNLTRGAYDQYKVSGGQDAPLKYYIGYPIHASTPNVLGQDYQDKARIFFAYARYDDGVCGNFVTCDTRSAYGEYLKRQYTDNF